MFNTRYRVSLLTVIALTLGSSVARAAEPAAEAAGGDALVTIIGTQACSLCEFGVGKECCLGIKVAGAMQFIVEGPACDKLFEKRHSGDRTHVEGTLFIKNGALYLTGKTLDLPASEGDAAAAEELPPALATGTLERVDGRLLLRSGATAIELVGDSAGKADKLVGQKIRAVGKFALEESGRVTLTASTVELAPAEPRS